MYLCVSIWVDRYVRGTCMCGAKWTPFGSQFSSCVTGTGSGAEVIISLELCAPWPGSHLVNPLMLFLRSEVECAHAHTHAQR